MRGKRECAVETKAHTLKVIVIVIRKTNQFLLLDYEPDNQAVGWVDEKLSSDGHVTLSKTFHFQSEHIFTGSIGLLDELTEEQRRFRLGVLEDHYYRIDGEILATEHDVMIHRSVSLNERTFTAHKGIAIFPEISRLVNGQIVIRRERPRCYPLE